MNGDTIAKSAQEIDRLQRVLTWLENCGGELEHSRGEFEFKLKLIFGGSLDGAEEAAAEIALTASRNLQSFMPATKDRIKNSIAYHRHIIMEQLNK